MTLVSSMDDRHAMQRVNAAILSINDIVDSYQNIPTKQQFSTLKYEGSISTINADPPFVDTPLWGKVGKYVSWIGTIKKNGEVSIDFGELSKKREMTSNVLVSSQTVIDYPYYGDDPPVSQTIIVSTEPVQYTEVENGAVYTYTGNRTRKNYVVVESYSGTSGDWKFNGSITTVDSDEITESVDLTNAKVEISQTYLTSVS